MLRYCEVNFTSYSVYSKQLADKKVDLLKFYIEFH